MGRLSHFDSVESFHSKGTLQEQATRTFSLFSPFVFFVQLSDSQCRWGARVQLALSRMAKAQVFSCVLSVFFLSDCRADGHQPIAPRRADVEGGSCESFLPGPYHKKSPAYLSHAVSQSVSPERLRIALVSHSLSRRSEVKPPSFISFEITFPSPHSKKNPKKCLSTVL